MTATPARIALVHADFNPKNLLVDPATGGVTGVLDWEFAYAGAPLGDLGNLLRFETDPVFAAAAAGHVRGPRAGRARGLAGGRPARSTSTR